ncbi:integrase family protein [Candidatus Nitrosopumilus koreensis AR1]|uniref:Integrase family protein n=1 Tax=Candidatus Nitrosopumilus koreensis AR1 TaxID=1229908 RepID=K0B9K0_9ARCH|nr:MULTISPECIES: tyrosine-type recombinase/integrase [Nitrosopumilus]AFS81141.1 integrase family protein [Candidatus Nitrosopumilus koreensis AR1]
MKLDISDVKSSAFQNFLDYIRNEKTRKKYTNDLQKFLDLIPDKIFEEKKIDTTDKTEAFVALVRDDVKIGKSIINAYVRELKKKVDSKEISPARVLNLIKPIKALFAANDIDFSWKMIGKSIPKPGKSKDMAYSREQLQMLMANATNLVDKIMITLSSSAGFRIEAWDYFTWEDVLFFYNDDNSLKGGALRVYHGDNEEYWTHFTPEAGKYLQLYKEYWKSRFMRYPKDSEPLVISVRIHDPKRIGKRGMESRMNTLAKKAGLRPPLEPGKKRHKVMLAHGLRKYFNTMMRRAKVNFLDKEDMMGHKVGLESHYERYQEDDFERFSEYQKAIPLLTISDDERMRVENEKLKSEKTELEQIKEDNEKILNWIARQENKNQK